MRRSRGKVATFRSIGIAERTTCNSSNSNGWGFSIASQRKLAKGETRRAVPPWSIPREIWLVMLRPRDTDIQETNRPIVTEADLNNRLLQTTSSKELLTIREKYERNKLPTVKHQIRADDIFHRCRSPVVSATRPVHTLMKRFKALISGLLGHMKGRGVAPDTWQRSAPVPLDKGTTKPGPARFRLVHLLCPFGKAFYGDLWRNRPNPCPREVNTYAHSKGRRREAAILIQHMVRWRLTREDVLAQIGPTMTGFDASNAFMSVLHTTLEASFEDEMDRSLMKQRYKVNHASKLCAHVVFHRETLPALLFSTTFTVNKLRNGKDTARRRTLTRNICMRSAFLQVTSTMHHPPFLPTTSRNELSRIPLRKLITKMGETSTM